MANPDGSKSGGRKAGTPNKLNAQVKEAIIEAFTDPKVGGKKYLIGLALGYPTDRTAFVSLLGKLLPSELKLDPESQLNLVVLKDYTGEHADTEMSDTGEHGASKT